MTPVSIIGNINVDIVARPVADLPAPGTEQAVDSIEFRVGGAGGIAALCLAGLGIRADLIGCVGSDPLGRVLLDELAQDGVPIEGVAVGGTTGICVATEAAGRDRSFLIAPGCVAEFALSQIPDRAICARQVVVCGYFLIPALRSGGAAQLLKEVRARGGETLLDTGWDPDGWPPAAKDEVIDLLQWVSVFAPNESEALAITGEASADQAARALQERSGGWCIVKRGARGAVGAGPGRARFAVPAPQVSVIDTTGAGDAFNAGIVRARMEGRPWKEAARFATLLASTVVSRPSHDRYPRLADLTVAGL
ncbi:MAG TPA: carbohydrate kinase family protein [Streptosporangiaceae bacterium]